MKHVSAALKEVSWRRGPFGGGLKMTARLERESPGRGNSTSRRRKTRKDMVCVGGGVGAGAGAI